jgi:hypothetical protein
LLAPCYQTLGKDVYPCSEMKGDAKNGVHGHQDCTGQILYKRHALVLEYEVLREELVVIIFF